MDAAWAGAGRFTIFSVAVIGMAFSGFDKFIDRASLANRESLDSVRRGGWSLYSDVGLQKKMAPAGERAVTLRNCLKSPIRDDRAVAPHVSAGARAEASAEFRQERYHRMSSL